MLAFVPWRSTSSCNVDLDVTLTQAHQASTRMEPLDTQSDAHIQLKPAGMGSISYVRLQQNHGDLHLEALYLNFL